MAKLKYNPWKFDNRTIVRASVFASLVIVLNITGLGSIPVPNLTMSMTTLMIPVTIGTLLCGPWVGLVSGFVMGMVYVVSPATSSFGPLVLIPPRIIMVIAAWYSYRVLSKILPIQWAVGFAAALAALTNTVVTIGIVVIFRYLPASIIWAVAPQAAIEMAGSGLIVPIVYQAVSASAPDVKID